MIRLAKIEDQQALFDLMAYCFQVGGTWIEMMEERFNPDQFICYQEDDGIISASLEMVPYHMIVNNHEVGAGGIAVVTSRPDYRYSGKTGKLMVRAIEAMKNKGYAFSALAPFSYEFYRKYGWEQAYDLKKYEIDLYLLKKFLDHDAKYHWYGNEAFDLWDLRNRFQERFNGGMKSDDLNKKDFQNSLRYMNYQVVSVGERRFETGYMIYEREKENFLVRELVWDSLDSLKQLLGYLYQHNAECEKVSLLVPSDDPIRWLLDEQNIATKNMADMMLRVIDVEKALGVTVSKNFEGSVCIKVIDPQASWNNGIFCIEKDGNGLFINKVESGEVDAVIDIQTFTQWSIGYLSYDELILLGKIDKKTDKNLSRIFNKKVTYMNERF